MSSEIADAVSSTAGEEWVITAARPGIRARIDELWTGRRLLRHFARDAVQRRYRRTRLGWPWLVVRPLWGVIAGNFIFGSVLGVKAGNDVPYFLFYLFGFTAWQTFSFGWMMVTRSLEANRRLLRKLYFPRLYLPLAWMVPGMVEICIYVMMMVVATIAFRVFDGAWYVTPGWGLLWALLMLPYLFAIVLGVGLISAVLGADNRDTRWSIRYVLQFWQYITPIFYPIALLPHWARWTAVVNPVSLPALTMQDLLVGHSGLRPAYVLGPLVITVVTLCFGLWFFHHSEAASLDRL
jgi:lipopolysaccharide transport system permease protein